ncbi:MAG TPA: hypothetical protein VIT88_09925 [Pyrinomonadaceae bacterium]
MQLTALIFVVFVAVGSLFSLIYFLLRKADKSATDFQWRLAAGMFSLLVTAVMMAIQLAIVSNRPAQDSGMDSTSDVSDNRSQTSPTATSLDSPRSNQDAVVGRIRGLAITLYGAPAIYVIVFLITIHHLPNKKGAAENREAVKSLPNGFDLYRNWREGLGQVQRVIDKSEIHFIDDLLPNVFYHGPHNMCKPKSVVNKTVFFFSERGAVKFQRIQGGVRTENGVRSRVYLPHTTSTATGQVSCLHFVRSGSWIKETASHEHGEWKNPLTDPIDILILAIYKDDDIESGDYIHVDTSKYVDLSHDDKATIKLAIAASRPIEDFQVWQVLAAPENVERPVPLMFRELYHQAERSAREIERNYEQIAEMLDGWDALLDEAANGKVGKTTGVSTDQIGAFLLQAKQVLTSDGEDLATFRELIRSRTPNDCAIRTLKKEQHAILSTFAWS